MENEMKVIVFMLNEQQYGVDIGQVRSIEQLQDITEIPRTSTFIKGVMNFRDDVIPIVDLKERLSLGQTNYTAETRILIVTTHEMQIGLIVDSATDVIDIDSSSIESAPKIIDSISTDYLSGVAKLTNELLLIIHVDSLFSDTELNEVAEAIEQ